MYILHFCLVVFLLSMGQFSLAKTHYSLLGGLSFYLISRYLHCLTYRKISYMADHEIDSSRRQVKYTCHLKNFHVLYGV